MIGIELSELAKGVSLIEEHADDKELNEFVNGLREFVLYILRRDDAVTMASKPYSYVDAIICHLLTGKLKIDEADYL